MEKYKVNSPNDNNDFIKTRSYYKLLKIFYTLKKEKGEIVHVIGAPGTGKSTNIFHAIKEAHLNYYDVKLPLKSKNSSSKEVFNSVFHELKKDLKTNSNKEVYEKLSMFDIVLISDSFHDAHILNNDIVGFSQWTDKAGFGAFYFYIMCIIEYIKMRRYFKNINLVFQTAWRVHYKGKKMDIFTDFGILSKIIISILSLFFIIVQISYSQEETIQIVKSYFKDATPEEIKRCIHKFGTRPRFICNAFENYKKL